MKLSVLFAVSTACLATVAMADNAILVQSTTSTKNAGLYDYILPVVKADTGITAVSYTHLTLPTIVDV